jgi:uncharacterized protein
MTLIATHPAPASHLSWHAQHEEQRASAHGFLAVTSLNWLTEEPQRFEDAPGLWWSDADGVGVEVGPGESLLLDGVELTGRHSFGAIPERGGLTLRSGRLAIEVARRGGRDLVRPRDPRHPTRTQYLGTPTYPPHLGWVRQGRFVPFAEPRPTAVGSVADGLEHVYEAPGRIEFELDGAVHSLTAFPAADGALLVLFTDATSGITTYGASRSLALDAPGPNGEVVLDFNRAVNLPCAYTVHATCPLPPAENRLPFPVEAGELLPLENGVRR